jgi:hypothetical protein
MASSQWPEPNGELDPKAPREASKEVQVWDALATFHTGDGCLTRSCAGCELSLAHSQFGSELTQPSGKSQLVESLAELFILPVKLRDVLPDGFPDVRITLHG